jgi:hypothetical protein
MAVVGGAKVAGWLHRILKPDFLSNAAPTLPQSWC